MRLVLIGSLVVATLASPAAFAEEVDPATPTDADRQVIAECIMLSGEDGASPLGCIGKVSDPCLAEPGNDNTPMMAACIEREGVIWDERLNDDYKALMAGLDPALAKRLKDSQRAWIAVRDATCDIEVSFWEGGTGYGGALAGCLMRETGARDVSLVALRTYLDQ